MTPTFPTTNDGTEAIQEHPDQITTDEPEYGYGERNIDLPDQLVEKLKEAVREAQGQEMYVRRREVIRDRTNRFYERGYQHVYANQDGFFFQAIAGQASPVANGETCPQYIGDFNIFRPFLRIQIAILTQNYPGVEFQPIDPNLAEDSEAASTADSYSKMFDRSNSIKQLQKQLVRMFGVSGRAVMWNRTEANAQKFGYCEDGTPKQMETCDVYGTLESKVPLTSKSQDNCGYCFLYDDPDINQAKGEYPEFADKIKPNMAGLGENAYERNARLGILQGTRTWAQMGDAFVHLCTRMHCWLRPWMFSGEKYDCPFDEPQEGDYVTDENGVERVMTVREKLCALFPLGVHAVFVGDVYVGSWAESMDDAIVIGFPDEGDGMFRQALMDCLVIVQDMFNDLVNGARQTFDVGWPSIWTDAEDTEYEAIRLQRAEPYAIRQKKARNGMPLEQSFYREPDPEVSSSFLKIVEMCEGPLPQFMLATPPALFGAEDDAQRTASGYAQARAQAMGQQATVWAEMQRMFARLRYQTALAASKNEQHSKEITVPGRKGESPNTFELARLEKGKFGAFPDPDSSFPESTAQKRQAFNDLLQQAALFPPIAAQIMSSPKNWKLAASLRGLSELEIPEANSWEKQELEIEELLQTEPIPPSDQQLKQAETAHATATIMAAQAQAPPPPPLDPTTLMKPTIQADRYDFHAYEFAACKDWLSSPDCRREQTQGNEQGVLNVRLHAAQHEKWMEILAPPPPPPNAPKQHPEPARPAPAPPPPPVNPNPVTPQAATM